jgi:flavin reductase (DIM6/NTAB) family NADH-FMN oxidoreductase RutF
MPLPAPPVPTVSGRTFVDAAAKLAGAAAIVAWVEDRPRGVLVRAVNLLSTQPPRVLFGVDKQDPDHDGLLMADRCSLNLLSDRDEAEADRFVRPDRRQERFAPVRWRREAGQPPRLASAVVHLAGVIDQRIDAGSHSLFVVRVDEANSHDEAPLVCFDHGFRRLQPRASSAGPELYLLPKAGAAHPVPAAPRSAP